ncbi:MAG: bifunctional (p)ppGpp synthetase/guanosine-3',5'-bis(diphosphate) 3'-pyrophosphohydrolase, partial [Ruminococcaceae bacterium]|nr:bifunctional (p)ppGpp synthetase/guanosine-3',5'-bis(diphosphate) 3'-pyrophosphohydrolase [Oscillospiraceae bacterium]
PVSVAEIVVSLGLDTDSVCAALLHDTVEDCGGQVSLEIIEKKFGGQVALLVDGLTKLVKIPFDDKEEEHIENLRKMFLAMSKDVRVIFIKLCDRLHNMRTLGVKKDAKRRMTALETMQVFAPLAHRLGMQKIKQELENLSLMYLDPVGYEEVQEDIKRRYGLSAEFLEGAVESIKEKMDELHYNFQIKGRVKSVYSLYRKIYEQGKTFEEIYDFYALRIITETELECYTMLGVIHDMFKSIPGRFKDYISTPKPNMYRSLHTTVIGGDGIPFEVQIRTREMHQVAEYGVAAHWKYKSGESSKESLDSKLEWIAKLIESENYTRDHDEFLRSLKIDMFHDEVFVFTPKGDVITLPQGSTMIDFAYAIHSAVGNRMVGAKINGNIVTIDSMPENGQIIEIITSSSSQGPSRDWLRVVKTGEARNKIRQWFKKEKRSENIVVGKNEIDREFKRFGTPCSEAQKEEIVSKVASRIGIHGGAEDLYNTIGYGGLSVSKISAKLKDEYEKLVKPLEEQKPLEAPDIALKPSSKPKGGIIVDGVDGCEVKYARCCNPLPGDSVVGFITKGYGISIHKVGCPNMERYKGDAVYKDRIVKARWDEEITSPHGSSPTFEAYIQVYAEQSMMLMANITTALADMRVALHQIATQNKSSNEIIINLVVGCKNIDHSKSIIARLKSIEGVVDVVRGYA